MKALRKGWVRVDGKRAKADVRLASGQVVRITNYAMPIPAIDAPLVLAGPRSVPPAEVVRARESVRLADAALVVSSKPAGAVVHAGSGHDWGWIDAVAHALGDTTPPVPIGRLDRDTSGLLVLGRTRPATRRLFDALREDTLARTYTALVLGRPAPSEGVIDLPLEKSGEPGDEQVRPTQGGQVARTRFRTLSTHGPATLLSVELDTGRTHQIRAHLAAIGHPLLGDPRYGTDASHALARRLGLERLFLHAGTLRLPHPETGAALVLEEPLPEELSRALRAL